MCEAICRQFSKVITKVPGPVGIRKVYAEYCPVQCCRNLACPSMHVIMIIYRYTRHFCHVVATETSPLSGADESWSNTIFDTTYIF